MATTVAAGASTTFKVLFSPSAIAARNAAIEIASNDADESTFDIAIVGTGEAVAAEFLAADTAAITSRGFVASGVK